jgi:gamma-glutamyltranspeptidase
LGVKGARAFYEGELAEDMAKTLAAKGSFLTAEDFAAHRGDEVTPISTNYRGLDLVEIRRTPGAHGAGDAQYPGEFRHCFARPVRC